MGCAFKGIEGGVGFGVGAAPMAGAAYRTGELKNRQLRALAEARPGDTFDVRAFQEAVHSNGAVPHEVLDENVVRHIDDTAESR